MDGYVAMARITHVAPHRASRHEPIDRDEANVVELGNDAVEEIGGEPFFATLRYWWDDVCEIVRQCMRVADDPRGWS